MGQPQPCPGCGTPAPPETRFCGQCGRDLHASSTEASPKRTMIGGAFKPLGATPPSGPPEDASDAPASAPAQRRDFAKTLFDPSVPTGGPPGAAAQPSKASPKRTMMGMPAVPLPSAAPGAQPPPSGDPPASSPAAPSTGFGKRTMLGMPLEAVAPPPATSAGAQPAGPPSAFAPVASAPSAHSDAAAEGSATPPSGPHRVKPPVSNRTMLGAAPPAELVAAAVASAPAPAAQSNRTMLGVGLGVGSQASAPTGASPVAPGPAAGAPADASLADIPGLPGHGRRRGFPVGLAVMLALAALVVVGVGAYLLLGGSTDLRASVGQTDEGEVLFIDLPGALEGTRVRFNGREQTLAAGRAAFSLAANDLQLGDNELTVDVIAPDGSIHQASVVLSLAYRVRADLSALEEDPPSLRVVVDAPPSATVVLDEQPVELDGTGHGHLAFPVDAAGDGPTYERTIHYRVVVDGEVSTGEVHVRIPFATLQIDRPGAHTVTDKATVELAGAAHPQARVTLDGNPLELAEGRFVASIPVPELGETEHVIVARQPGRAPRVRKLAIRRVADLAAEAAAYPVDPSLTYARIAQNPESYRGQHVAFEGRVYNVDVHDGQSVLQIVARECPRGQRCALWVAFDGATDAQLNDWVRVLGEVAGEQQFRTPSGEVRTVPRVDAAFVLSAEAAPPRTRRGRR